MCARILWTGETSLCGSDVLHNPFKNPDMAKPETRLAANGLEGLANANTLDLQKGRQLVQLARDVPDPDRAVMRRAVPVPLLN